MNNPRVKHSIKQLIALSLDDHKRLHEPFVLKIIHCLKQSKKREAHQVLLAYCKTLLRISQSREACVEFAGSFDETLKNALIHSVNTTHPNPFTFRWNENPDLIAGCRLSIADDRIEFSIRQQLLDLKNTFKTA